MNIETLVDRKMKRVLDELATDGISVTAEDVRGPSRSRRLMAIRKRIAVELDDTGLLTLREIAHALGRRDHSTVIYYLRTA